MITKTHDLFSKTLLSGLFELQGETRMEVEIPLLDALRFDLWYAPDAVKRRNAPKFGGVLAEVAEVSAVIEMWSDRVGLKEFHDSYDKRHAWWRALEARAKAACPRPKLWHFCANRPSLVLKQFGFKAVEGSSGHLTTVYPGWQVEIVVISELVPTRETLLLRLLGDESLRVAAIHELDALPDDAWEKGLAMSWVNRLQSHTSSRLKKEFLMTTMLEWYQEVKRRENAALALQVTKKVTKKVTQKVTQKVTKKVTKKVTHALELHLFERRLGRKLTAAEQKVLARRVQEFDAQTITDIALDYSPVVLAAWLNA